MKTKWNWGTKLVIWIVAFILFILTLVYMSLSYDVNLVERDYYPKGLKYQNRINAIENARNIVATIKISQNKDDVYLTLNNINPDSGNINFFRPSDNSYDRIYELDNPEQKEIIIPRSEFILGKYIIKCNWWMDNREYYVEQVYSMK